MIINPEVSKKVKPLEQKCGPLSSKNVHPIFNNSNANFSLLNNYFLNNDKKIDAKKFNESALLKKKVKEDEP